MAQGACLTAQQHHGEGITKVTTAIPQHIHAGPSSHPVMSQFCQEQRLRHCAMAERGPQAAQHIARTRTFVSIRVCPELSKRSKAYPGANFSGERHCFESKHSYHLKESFSQMPTTCSGQEPACSNSQRVRLCKCTACLKQGSQQEQESHLDRPPGMALIHPRQEAEDPARPRLQFRNRDS